MSTIIAVFETSVYKKVSVMAGTTRKCKKTRNSVKSGLFGTPRELKDLILPTYADVMRHYYWLRNDLIDDSRKFDAVGDLVKVIGERIIEIWTKASIPVISKQRITTMIKAYYGKCRLHEKSLKRGKGQKKLREVFIKQAKTTLFDIAACKCRSPGECSCERKRKVPKREAAFLQDQRTDRRMAIGNIDIKTTKALRKTEERQNRDLSRRRDGSSAAAQQSDLSKSSEDIEESGSIFSDNSNDYDFEPEASSSCRLKRVYLSHTASATFRTGASERQAALIASAALQDMGIITPEDKELVVDRYKIRRDKKKLGQQIQEEEKLEGRSIQSIYFDGRKDKTQSQEIYIKKVHRRVIQEEHITVLSEPESEYLGHLTPSSGHGSEIAKTLLDFLHESEADISKLVAIGCDGTSINTGNTNGVIACLENSLRRELQHLVCLFHTNELPLRHLMTKLDGNTKGPNTFAGPVGVKLTNCEKLRVVSFKSIPVTWVSEMEHTDDLSTDQEYLLEICNAVSTGECSQSLRYKKPGPIVQSRWLTTACRILRLYVSTLTPDVALQHLAHYVVKVYAPVWFGIKQRPSCKDGARHLWKLVTLSKFLPPEVRDIVHSVVQTNGYYAHPENLLIAMATDPRPHVRTLAWRRIKKSRTLRTKETNKIRKFQVPPLNFKAEEYYECIDWFSLEVTEPPVTRRLPLEQIEKNIKVSAMLEDNLVAFPCHTQAVERMVKIVTEAASKVCGREERDKVVRAVLKSRKLMPHFNSKRDYVQ